MSLSRRLAAAVANFAALARTSPRSSTTKPDVFSVERHVRGKWACTECQTLVQAPVASHIIDKGIPTTGLLAQVLVVKYADHLPLYRQESIFARAGLAIARSTLAQWVGACGVQLQPLVDALKDEMLAQAVLHADETPVAMLKPGHGATHRAYLWSYCTTKFNPVKAGCNLRFRRKPRRSPCRSIPWSVARHTGLRRLQRL